jgi:hypothetical protein
MFEHYGITLAHIGILIGHSYIDGVIGFHLILQCISILIGFLFGLLNLWFHKIHGYSCISFNIMPMAIFVTIGMTYIDTLVKLWISVVTLAHS